MRGMMAMYACWPGVVRSKHHRADKLSHHGRMRTFHWDHKAPCHERPTTNSIWGKHKTSIFIHVLLYTSHSDTCSLTLPVYKRTSGWCWPWLTHAQPCTGKMPVNGCAWVNDGQRVPDGRRWLDDLLCTGLLQCVKRTTCVKATTPFSYRQRNIHRV